MPGKLLKEFLDKEKVRYETITHSPAYSSQKTAAAAHVSGRDLAKTVMIKLEGKMAMAVLPGSSQIDFARLREGLGTERVELATEEEFRDRFPDCELGAMPPFGNLYGMHVFVAETLTQDEEIAFNAGTHTELIKMAYRDFERLVRPKVLRFAATPVG